MTEEWTHIIGLSTHQGDMIKIWGAVTDHLHTPEPRHDCFYSSSVLVPPLPFIIITVYQWNVVIMSLLTLVQVRSLQQWWVGLVNRPDRKSLTQPIMWFTVRHFNLVVVKGTVLSSTTIQSCVKKGGLFQLFILWDTECWTESLLMPVSFIATLIIDVWNPPWFYRCGPAGSRSADPPQAAT